MNERLSYLFQAYIANNCTDDEREELMNLARLRENEDAMELLIAEYQLSPRPQVRLSDSKADEIFMKIVEQSKPAKKPVISMAYRWMVAAAAVLLLAVGAWWIWGSQQQTGIKHEPIAHSKIQDVAPGKDGAILTLANGQKIVLDSAANGNISNVAVKNGNQLSYTNKVTGKPEYNTMSTPVGRQFSLVLADGSKVWLNATSSITYPTAFDGNERKVQITGEAYFEVAHNPSMPFIVSVNDMKVEVLGTHFNINSYADEDAIKTTLFQGKVRVSKNGKVAMLNPGQQAVVNNQSLNINNSPGLDEVIAWKNGKFSFGESTSLNVIMRQLSRWYGVEVIYKDNVQQQFGGSISMQSNISQVLEKLQLTGKVHFTIEGNKVTVSK